jgi:hypothetical protein
LSTLGIIQSVIKTELREAIDNESVDAWVVKTAAFIDKIQIELGATQHAFTDYRASHAMKSCMMCNSLERVHCYANTEKLEARVAELEEDRPSIEHGKNRYGVDVAYFRKTINRELNRDLSNFKPDELARVFARLSVTADSSVVHEREFQAKALKDQGNE